MYKTTKFQNNQTGQIVIVMPWEYAKYAQLESDNNYSMLFEEVQ